MTAFVYSFTIPEIVMWTHSTIYFDEWLLMFDSKDSKDPHSTNKIV